jgi:hypothetical protein
MRLECCATAQHAKKFGFVSKAGQRWEAAKELNREKGYQILCFEEYILVFGG